jgi:hypothetical protein
MRVVVSQPVPPYAVFTHATFKSTIGTTVPYQVDGETYVWAIVEDAVVAPDGKSVEWTLDTQSSPIRSGMELTEDGRRGYRNRKGQFFENVRAVDVTTPAEYRGELDGVLTLYLWGDGDVTWKEPER